MQLHSEERIPPTAINQLRWLCRLLSQSLPQLKGVILHGSAASAGFEPDRSDLDVLAIVDGDADARQLAQVGEGILRISGEPHPLEFSVVSYQALKTWRHPCPHLLHFGEAHRENFAAAQFLPESPTDDDLAMHLTVARARGIDLIGTFPVSDLPQIPRSDYLTAIYSDFEWAQGQEEDLSGYVFANACRTLAYLTDDVILSKSEGRQWCEQHQIDAVTVVAEVMEALQRELASRVGPEH